MKIYLIEEKKVLKPYSELLEKYGKVVILDSGEKDISKYIELFADNSEKVIGVNTGIIEWEFSLSSLKRIKNLKGIASKSSWVNYLDLNYCRKKGIVVNHLVGANSQSVAEYAIWMMFCLARKLPFQIENNFKVILNENSLHTEIESKTMGILGLGHIGERVAKIGKGLGMNVIYWSRKTKDKRYKYMKLEDVLSKSDVLFNCVQTLEETRGFLNKERINLLKPSTYVISVISGMGWGPQDDKYLVDMVNKGKLAGYAVENEYEPSFNKPKIVKGKNVFIPGNYAYWTKEAQERSNRMWIENVISLAKGIPINVVN